MEFFSDDQASHFLRTVAKHLPDSVRIGILSVNNQPIATMLGFLSEKTFYAYHTAFIEEYQRFGPGKIAYYLMLEELKQMGVVHIDLLRGNSELKQEFARKIRTQYDVYVSKHRTVIAWWRIMLACWDILRYGSSLQRRIVSSLPRRISSRLTPQT